MSRMQQIVAILEGHAFGFPVAIYPGTDVDLGPVVEVDAFDVPAGAAVAVARELAGILWQVRERSDAGSELLPGVVYDFESADRRPRLPAATVWYRPRARSPMRG